LALNSQAAACFLWAGSERLLAITVMIVIVGSGITVPPDREFTIEDLGDQIESSLGYVS
jgi:hypothetical protein